MFRFTIRDVLWLMVVVGLGVGWWAGQERSTAKVKQVTAAIERLEFEHKGIVSYLVDRRRVAEKERDEANAEKVKATQAWNDIQLELAIFRHTNGPGNQP